MESLDDGDGLLPSRLKYDIWICQGRMCSSKGSHEVAEAVVDAARLHPEAARCRVLRGGCYGLCDLGPNVIVRRFLDGEEDISADRLTLTDAPNETVYCGVDVVAAPAIVTSHLDHDAPLTPLTRDVRTRELEATTPIEQRMRALREARALAIHAGPGKRNEG